MAVIFLKVKMENSRMPGLVFCWEGVRVER